MEGSAHSETEEGQSEEVTLSDFFILMKTLQALIDFLAGLWILFLFLPAGGPVIAMLTLPLWLSAWVILAAGAAVMIPLWAMQNKRATGRWTATYPDGVTR